MALNVLIDVLTAVAKVVELGAPNVTGTPKFEPSILNWTDPVGVPVPAVLVTVAVKGTPPPYVDGFAEEATRVLVAALDGRFMTMAPF